MCLWYLDRTLPMIVYSCCDYLNLVIPKFFFLAPWNVTLRLAEMSRKELQMFKSSPAGATAHCSYVFCMLSPRVNILNCSQMRLADLYLSLFQGSMLQVGLSTPIHTSKSSLHSIGPISERITISHIWRPEVIFHSFFLLQCLLLPHS